VFLEDLCFDAQQSAEKAVKAVFICRGKHFPYTHELKKLRQAAAREVTMALHPNFPDDPHAILDPAIRWFPADEALRTTSFEKLLPPLVPTLRKEVKAWRDRGYDGACETSKSLLRWWFVEQHLLPNADTTLHEFKYFFAQREALETIVYLIDVVGVKDKYDLMRYDSSGAVSTGMFDETWRRFVIKMATGSGKTKVLSLVLAWSFFHKLYETDSSLARNFLVIAPNIIVLDRIRKDFDGLRVFFQDPVLPDNGLMPGPGDQPGSRTTSMWADTALGDYQCRNENARKKVCWRFGIGDRCLGAG
jgi:hypothetical protein